MNGLGLARNADDVRCLEVVGACRLRFAYAGAAGFTRSRPW
jgi:hypothetical protein